MDAIENQLGVVAQKHQQDLRSYQQNHSQFSQIFPQFGLPLPLPISYYLRIFCKPSK